MVAINFGLLPSTLNRQQVECIRQRSLAIIVTVLKFTDRGCDMCIKRNIRSVALRCQCRRLGVEDVMHFVS